MSFVIYSCKTGKCWNQNDFTNLKNFDSNSLICDLPCFLAKIVQILQKVVAFFLERGEEIEL